MECKTGDERALLVTAAGVVVALDLREIEGFRFAVERVNQQRHAHELQVDSDLVLTAGERPAAHERGDP